VRTPLEDFPGSRTTGSLPQPGSLGLVVDALRVLFNALAADNRYKFVLLFDPLAAQTATSFTPLYLFDSACHAQ
jgi:hypothetical protein